MGLGIRKGDMVRVISGRDRGALRKVLAVFPQRDKALVEGVNIVKRHTKPRGQNQPGGIIEKGMPIHLSNLMLVDPKTNQAVRFTNERTEQGNKVRRSKATKNEI